VAPDEQAYTQYPNQTTQVPNPTLSPSAPPEPTPPVQLVAASEGESMPSIAHNIHGPVESLAQCSVRPQRERRPPARLQDFVCNAIRVHDPCSSPLHETSSSTSHPLSNFIDYNRFSSSHRAFLASVTSHFEPKYYSQAVKDPRWCDAMAQEIRALEENHTWSLTALPLGKKVLGCKWIYKMKYKADGTIERYKASLVVLGNTQVQGEDYTETFAPVAKMVTVHILLTVAITKGWELHQMDVNNAFLHGDLLEDIYMKPPPGFRTS